MNATMQDAIVALGKLHLHCEVLIGEMTNLQCSIAELSKERAAAISEATTANKKLGNLKDYLHRLLRSIPNAFSDEVIITQQRGLVLDVLSVLNLSEEEGA
jgi:hypothetical protein